MRMRRATPSLHSADVVEPMLNLTSLIDVVFVVLIMFIVIAPLLDIDRISLAHAGGQPKEKVEALSPAATVCISVDANNSLMFNKKQISIEQLQTILRHIHKKFPNIRPQLLQDKKAYFGSYQSVKNAVEEAGFKELDVILLPGS